jgi:hypothetical protein
MIAMFKPGLGGRPMDLLGCRQESMAESATANDAGKVGG